MRASCAAAIWAWVAWRSRCWVLWVQCGGSRLQPLEVAGDLGQRLGQLVVGSVRVFADDLQQRLGGVFRDPKSLADPIDVLLLRFSRALHSRFGRLLELRVRQTKIAGDRVVAGATATRDSARTGFDLIAQSKCGGRHGD
jgi:hypothetical protein